MDTVETARCVDCYTVSFADEMDLCPEGHPVCPGCLCDCTVRAYAREHWMLPLQAEVIAPSLGMQA